MRSSFAPLVVGGVLVWGCASPTSGTDTGTGGSSQTGTAGNGSSGSAGTGSGNSTGQGQAGTTGSGNSGGQSGSSGGGSTGTGTAGTSGACTPGNPSNIVEPSGWICDKDTPVMIQGSWYAYGDSTA